MLFYCSGEHGSPLQTNALFSSYQPYMMKQKFLIKASVQFYARAKYVVILANRVHERGTAARRIRKNGVTKTDYSVNSMLNYILFARALSSQMSAISIARNNPFFSLDLISCFLGER